MIPSESEIYPDSKIDNSYDQEVYDKMFLSQDTGYGVGNAFQASEKDQARLLREALKPRRIKKRARKPACQKAATAKTEVYPKWRSIESDPPPQYEGVLVSDGCVFGVALQIAGGEWQDSNTGEPLAYASIGAMEQWVPTHWMPLPENP